MSSQNISAGENNRSQSNNNNNNAQSSKASDVSTGRLFASTPAINTLIEATSRRAVRFRSQIGGFSSDTDGSAPEISSIQESSTAATLSDVFGSPIAHPPRDNLIQSVMDQSHKEHPESQQDKTTTTATTSATRRSEGNFEESKPSRSGSVRLFDDHSLNDLKLNKYKSLVESLQILKTVANMDRHDASAGWKRGNKPTASPIEFKITEGMFMTNNSEAFFHVTHFLFEMLDKGEADRRFLVAWPIHEKRQEGDYRRRAVEWFEEIIHDNPKFFTNKVKVEQLNGLIVKPFGDRFIRFIHAFVDLVMYKVTHCEDTIDDPLLMKPAPPKHKEPISHKQRRLLASRNMKLAKIARAEQADFLHETIIANNTAKKIEKFTLKSESDVKEKVEIVSQLIKRWPEYFPSSAQDLLESQQEFFRSQFKAIPLKDKGAALQVIQSPLNEYVNQLWEETAESLESKIKGVEGFFLDNSRLWLLLKSLSSKLLPPSIFQKYFRTSGAQTLESLLTSYAETLSEFLSKLDAIQVPESLISNKAFVESKLLLLKQKSEEINQIQFLNLANLKQKVKFEIQKLSIELEDVNWSELSRVNGPSLSSMFNFSPTRLVDKHKQTGFTPALSSYLPVSHTDKLLRKVTDRNSSRHNPETPVGVGPTQRKPGNRVGPSRLVISEDTSKTLESNSRTSFQQPTKTRLQGLPTISDSPVTHFSHRASMERSMLLQNPNVSSRHISISELSLPSLMPEDEGQSSAPGNSDDGLSSSAREEFGNALSLETASRQTVGLSHPVSSTIEEKLNAIMLSLTLPDTSLVEKETKGSRRRSLNPYATKDNKYSDTSMNQSRVLEGLEDKLGILDITTSYADFLLKSTESDSTDSDD